ncbi:hypothetical protein RclHR1_05070011 [Rhizophagus clarus]|uniref:F-box domain-containing protein n=1 Tax=Rhizophagus clarus TaxID=94130 RepID=A0A2Z6SDQ0_9GLOM|nr:hypothetical protein RclHR1_05070011 [Rhizophagus clarus]GES86372.1 hypothetical protein GLOIN_2v1791318 [Rhizophagus clarus]
MVNRLWCETVIPILWRTPWRNDNNYRNKNSLYSIITSYLSNDIKEFLAKKGIQTSGQSPAFDYLSFCKSIDVKIINEIISIGSSSKYNRFLLQEEIYSFLIKKCPEIKYLNIRGTYELVYLPEAEVRLESLCELTCDTSIDPKYFYRISHICQQIQNIIIINNNYKVNYGTIKLIEFQKNLRYFEWVDDLDRDDFDVNYYMSYDMENPYTYFFDILKKHASTLNHIEISLDGSLYNYYDYYNNHNNYNDFDHTCLQYILLELHNLKEIVINFPIFSNDYYFNIELESMVDYRNLESFVIDTIDIYHVTCIIKNSFYLKELWIDEYTSENLVDDSLDFIQTIYENCPLIEHLSIPTFPLLGSHFIEFEKLLKKCQNMSALHFIYAFYKEGKDLDYGEYLSDVLVEASMNLREIGFSYHMRFSLEDLETFLEKWKGRPAISIYLCRSFIYEKDESYKDLISKYKTEGVIKYISIFE